MARQSSVERLRAKVRELEAQLLDLGQQNWNLALALLEKTGPQPFSHIPVKLPPEWFQDIGFAITEPLPEHPDGGEPGVDPGLLVLARALDERLAYRDRGF